MSLGSTAKVEEAIWLLFLPATLVSLILWREDKIIQIEKHNHLCWQSLRRKLRSLSLLNHNYCQKNNFKTEIYINWNNKLKKISIGDLILFSYVFHCYFCCSFWHLLKEQQWNSNPSNNWTAINVPVGNIFFLPTTYTCFKKQAKKSSICSIVQSFAHTVKISSYIIFIEVIKIVQWPNDVLGIRHWLSHKLKNIIFLLSSPLLSFHLISSVGQL